MRDNGRGMQILHPGHNVSTLADGVASAVITATEYENIRLLVTSDTVKLFIGLPADAAESKAHTLIVGENYKKVVEKEIVIVYGGTAELMY